MPDILVSIVLALATIVTQAKDPFNFISKFGELTAALFYFLILVFFLYLLTLLYNTIRYFVIGKKVFNGIDVFIENYVPKGKRFIEIRFLNNNIKMPVNCKVSLDRFYKYLDSEWKELRIDNLTKTIKFINKNRSENEFFEIFGSKETIRLVEIGSNMNIFIRGYYAILLNGGLINLGKYKAEINIVYKMNEIDEFVTWICCFDISINKSGIYEVDLMNCGDNYIGK